MSIEKQYRVEHKWDGVACPHCNKLFKVSRRDLFPIDYYSFSCLSCHEFFWAALDASHKLDIWTEKPEKPHPLVASASGEEIIITDEKVCPHCFYSSKKGVMECYQCGLSFTDEKWAEQLPYASYSLRRSYEYLLKNFGQLEEHKKFVKQCMQEENILFGIKCYSRFLKVHPNNKYSRKMVKFFEAVLFERMNKQRQPSFLEGPQRTYKQGWLHSMILFFALGVVALLAASYKMMLWSFL